MRRNYPILVVDDDPEDQMIFREYLNEFGIQGIAHFVSNGKQAMDYLEGIKEECDQLPSLVILDLNMPVLNGIQTLRQMKNMGRYRYIPVIVFSTSANEAEKHQCLQLGAVDYLVKPSSYAEGKLMIDKFCSFVSSHNNLHRQSSM
jgi:CheY-like chemotaxis protein